MFVSGTYNKLVRIIPWTKWHWYLLLPQDMMFLLIAIAIHDFSASDGSFMAPKIKFAFSLRLTWTLNAHLIYFLWEKKKLLLCVRSEFGLGTLTTKHFADTNRHNQYYKYYVIFFPQTWKWLSFEEYFKLSIFWNVLPAQKNRIWTLSFCIGPLIKIYADN